MSVSVAIACTSFRLTLVAVAAASTLEEDSCMLAPTAGACCMHSWEVRMLAAEEQVGWGLRRLRVPERRRPPLG
jgi:hypothetical protein